MRLLILNPNTSASVTERLRLHAQTVLAERAKTANQADPAGAATPADQAAAPTVQLLATTATLGASYIASEASYAIAGHAALDAWAAFAAAGGQADALLLGCFGDPGTHALRELTGLPVVGLAEAAMRQAAQHGRFAIVTGGLAWVPMLQRLARSLGLGDALVAVHAVAPSGAELAANPAAALALLAQACCRAAEQADVVILGGAGLAGYARQLAGQVPVPLIDSASAGIEWLLRHHADGSLCQPPAPGAAPGWSGLAGALSQTLVQGRGA